MTDKNERFNPPVGVDALTNLMALPLLRDGTWMVGTDSHDVTGGNNDGFEGSYSYLYKDGDEYVLFEEEGPGCVYLVRTICHGDTLRIYLDGADEPQHEFFFGDMYAFQEEHAPFLEPLVAPENRAHGSSWSYVPIPFNSGCKLTTKHMDKPHFYNVFTHKYAQGTAVTVFDPETAMEDVAAMWKRPDLPRPEALKGDKQHGTLTMPPRQTGVMLDAEGAGAVTLLKLRFPEDSEDDAADLILRGYFDGRVEPHIASPISTFFAMGCPPAIRAKKHGDPGKWECERYIGGAMDPRSLVVGRGEDGWLYCHFPMPFWKSARLELVNRNETRSITVEYELVQSSTAYPEDATGYFNARWRTESPLRISEDYSVLDTRGRGHFVGCVLTMSTLYRDSPYRDFFLRIFLEGDARLYADDVRTPLGASTGTEEYFNWGWYDMRPQDGLFSYPTHGYPTHVVEREDHSVMYRFHVSDVVPYYRAFRFELEHGPTGTTQADYSGTAFYYQRDEPQLRLTDELDICDEASEQAHGYACEGQTGTERHTLPYEGSYQLKPVGDAPVDRVNVVKDEGRAWNGLCTFTVAIAPQNNGVKLRRRSYYAFGAAGELGSQRPEPVLTPRQRVGVKVDGVEIADWLIPAGHARDTWRDTDYEIPAGATAGKDKIAITLTAKEGTSWDEYTYWVYTYGAGKKA